MSTYYALTCPKCKETSGFSFSRQAWGWGNADIVETFKFLMAHAMCGGAYCTDLQIVSEDSDYYSCDENSIFTPEGWTQANFLDEKYRYRYPHGPRESSEEWEKKYE